MLRVSTATLLTVHILIFGAAPFAGTADDETSFLKTIVIMVTASGENEEEDEPDPGEGFVAPLPERTPDASRSASPSS